MSIVVAFAELVAFMSAEWLVGYPDGSEFNPQMVIRMAQAWLLKSHNFFLILSVVNAQRFFCIVSKW